MEWDCKVPIVKNKLIWKQLGIAIGVPFGILLVFLMIIEAYYGILIVILTFILTAILVMIVFRGTYDVHYEITQKGIIYKNQQEQVNRIKKLSLITFAFGLLSKNATAAGAGLLSGASTEVNISFKEIRKIKYNDKQKYIFIHGGFAKNMAVFCTLENYDNIKKCLSDLIKLWTENK